jgi:hypothetical protein
VRLRQGPPCWAPRAERVGLVRVPSARRAFRRCWASTACQIRRHPPSRLRSPRLRCQVVFRPDHGLLAFPSLCFGVRANVRGRTLARSLQDATTGSVGVTPVEIRTGPAVKTSGLAPHASWHGSCRWWHPGFKPRILAAGPAPVSHYSYFARPCRRGWEQLSSIVKSCG